MGFPQRVEIPAPDSETSLEAAYKAFRQTAKGTPEHDLAWDRLVDAIFPRPLKQPTSAPKSKALLVEAFTHPQDSPQRLQVFSKFLKALRDENAQPGSKASEAVAEQILNAIGQT